MIPSLRESLKHLQLDYVDLYLIHWPCAVDSNDVFGVDVHLDNELDIYAQTWPGMEEAVALGLAKNVGISNFNSKQIDKLLKVCIKCFICWLYHFCVNYFSIITR